METLQRIYGISFPDPKMLKDWEKFQEEAKNRDHRKLGRVGTEAQNFQKEELEVVACKFRLLQRQFCVCVRWLLLGHSFLTVTHWEQH